MVAAVRIHAFGGPENMVYEQVDVGAPGAGEVAAAIMFLLSDAASYVNGANLRVSGAR
jgi:NAD(P)-dependent dehydrogenase (short-subunit alcohol dehydrogenase family)